MVRIVPKKGEEFAVDANVLIDVRNADLSILKLFVDKVAPLHVLQPIVDEVGDVTGRDLERLGVSVVHASAEDILAVSQRARALSLQDALCVEECSKSGHTCISNDKAVRAECGRRGIARMWGLEMLLFLVEAGALRRAKAHSFAKEMRRHNPAHITEAILDDLRGRLFPNE